MSDGLRDGLSAKPLSLKQVDQAYALVRAVTPDLPQDRWRRFAAGLIDGKRKSGDPKPSPSRGIMTVQNQHDYILGLFSYDLTEHLRHGRALSVDNLVVLDLFDMGLAMKALMGAMETLARDLGCTAIHTDLPIHYRHLPESCMAAFDSFRKNGAVELGRLCLLLEEPPCRPLPQPLLRQE